MRLILLCGLFAISLAQAEVMGEPQAQRMAARLKEACMGSNKAGGLTPDEIGSACTCAESRYLGKLRVTQFSSINNASNDDVKRLRELNDDALLGCIKPAMQKSAEVSIEHDCLAGRKDLGRPLTAKERPAACSCLAKRYSTDVDYMALGSLPQETRKARLEMLWNNAVAACVPAKSAKGSG